MICVLSEDEIQETRRVFDALADGRGEITISDLKYFFQSLERERTDLELFQMVHDVGLATVDPISFQQFVQILGSEKKICQAADDESDLIDAFTACGGEHDTSGYVERNTLIKIVKDDFGLQIDIENMINKYDTDGSGEIEYSEFKQLLS